MQGVGNARGEDAGAVARPGAAAACLVRKYLDDFHTPLGQATIAIQGLGNVGGETASALARAGAKIIAISDYTGGIFNPRGIDIRKAVTYVRSQKVLHNFD